jgi:hypothetical protein
MRLAGDRISPQLVFNNEGNTGLTAQLSKGITIISPKPDIPNGYILTKKSPDLQTWS